MKYLVQVVSFWIEAILPNRLDTLLGWAAVRGCGPVENVLSTEGGLERWQRAIRAIYPVTT